MPYGARRRPEDGIHKVEDGDTVSSVAASYGFTEWAEKVWDAAENSELKTQRVNPNTLAPGDEVYIPELERKDESRPTDEWHDFHVVRNKRYLRLKLQDENSQPIANKAYEIRPHSSFRGTFVQQGTTTDDEGRIEEKIPHTMTEAELVLPDTGLAVQLRIGYLQPLPMGEPIQASPAEAIGDALGGIADAASGGLGGLAGAATGAAGSLAGAAKGAASGSASGGASIGSGGISGDFSGAADAAGSLAGQVQGAMSGLSQNALSTAAGMAQSAVGAVAGALGEFSFGDEENSNIYPSAQRLNSMGFDAGKPKNNKRTSQFTAGLMAFQTWCKEQGALSDSAGGPLGDLTAPGGALGGGMGGPLGGMAASVVGPALAAVGLTGQLDPETIEALKKTHGC